MNRLSLDACDRVQHDVCINQSVSVKLVGYGSLDQHQSSTDFDVRGVWAVVNGVAGLVFRFVVHGFEAFLFHGHVVDVADRHKDTPYTLFVGRDGLGEVGVVVAEDGDVHLWDAFTEAGCAVVVEVPVDFATDLNFKRSVDRVQNKRVVFIRIVGRERCVAGVHEPRFRADGSVEVETPRTGHQQFGGVAVPVGALKRHVAKSIVADGRHRHVRKGGLGDGLHECHGDLHTG